MNGRRGYTLLEMMIATAIVAALTLSIGALTLALRRPYSDSNLRVSMDDDARRWLLSLRRELRQSGYALDGTPEVTLPAPGTITFRMRTGPDDATGWSEQVTYRRVLDAPATFVGVAGAVPRYKVERVVGPVAAPVSVTDLLHDVSDLQLTLPAGGNTLLVRLELLRPDPIWTGQGPPPPLRHVYEDEVELLNAPLRSAP